MAALTFPQVLRANMIKPLFSFSLLLTLSLSVFKAVCCAGLQPPCFLRFPLLLRSTFIVQLRDTLIDTVGDGVGESRSDLGQTGNASS